jgi:cytosine permease
MLKRENSSIWNLWIAAFIILSGWATNNLNLYSSAVNLETLWKKSSERSRTWLIGISAIFLACFDLLSRFEIVLEIMGVFIASMGAVIISRYTIEQVFCYQVTPKDQSWHLIAWSIGIMLGFLGIAGISMTGVSLLDSMIGASTLTCLNFACREFYEKTYT